MSFRRVFLSVALTIVPTFALTETSLPNIITETTSVGNSAAFSTRSPALALTPIIRVGGEFDRLGEVKWFGGNFAPGGYIKAEGQLLDINQNQALFSRLGTTYGGDGRNTFAVPDLRGRAVVGAGDTVQQGTIYSNDEVILSPHNLPSHTHVAEDAVSVSSFGSDTPTAIDVRAPSVALNYQINTFGLFPSRSATAVPDATDLLGATSGGGAQLAFLEIDAASSLFEDREAVDAAGQTLAINSNSALFSLLGTTYGGDGRTVFSLPDTDGRTIIGQGTGPGLTEARLGQTDGADTVTIGVQNLPSHAHGDAGAASGQTQATGGGQAISIEEENLALNFVVALTGVFPSQGSANPSDSNEQFLGEIALFAGNFAPRGWAFAHGQQLAISQYSALFSLFGTSYGGDGRVTFNLPDLRGRTPIGVSDTIRIGQSLGAESVNLLSNNLPAHTHTIERMAPVPLPAGMLLMLSAIAGFGVLRRKSVHS